jgi:hypothetical protein
VAGTKAQARIRDCHDCHLCCYGDCSDGSSVGGSSHSAPITVALPAFRRIEIRLWRRGATSLVSGQVRGGPRPNPPNSAIFFRNGANGEKAVHGGAKTLRRIRHLIAADTSSHATIFNEAQRAAMMAKLNRQISSMPFQKSNHILFSEKHAWNFTATIRS